ncbi:AI-2E family transporter [Paraglaciecola aquimarina]|uniref:AI-2E family transporter n=1 Tax=Paraglaciecola aquimarina TaxID=1235557 RepID=A0ABU3SV18_9ALTE|nr:AI-2E family transporter [Paraglaciecola aquimarina]MDU0353840.1 AI-2E family transporter [Paraglaciecola aquimarina]
MDTGQSTSNQINNTSKLKGVYCSNWLLLLAIIYTLYFAQSLIIPLVLAILIALLLNPLVTNLSKMHIPRAISSVVLLAMLTTPFTIIGVELIEPAQKWAKLIPKLSVHVNEQVESISGAFEEEVKETQKLDSSWFNWFSRSNAPKPKQKPANLVTERIKQGGMELVIDTLGATPIFFAQLLGSAILILFLLIFGPSLFAAFVKELALKEQREKAIHLVEVTQKQLSTYIITASLINLGLGLSTAIALYFIGLEDALLWGVIVAVLNFIPYIGSVIGVVILSMAGMVHFGVTLSAFIPVAAYLLLNIIESQVITPTAMGKKMLINPLVIMLWLLVCGWLWGLAGVLLSVPLLVCIKLVLSELGIWTNWLRVIEAGKQN